jgi:hypothetical protein
MHLSKFSKQKKLKNNILIIILYSFKKFFDKNTFKHFKVLLIVFSISENDIKLDISKCSQTIKLSYRTT